MNYKLAIAFSLSISIAAIIGWIRFRKIDPAFYPFIFLVTVATLTELTGLIAVKLYKTNTVVYNFYSIIEALLICWQFKKWKLFSHNILFIALVTFLSITWLLEVFVSGISTFHSYFIIAASAVIVFLSIHMINRLIIEDDMLFAKNPALLISAAFILFFTFTALIEIFWLYGLDASRSFRLHIYRIFYFINLFTNLIYALAILWMPKKREFIQLS